MIVSIRINSQIVSNKVIPVVSLLCTVPEGQGQSPHELNALRHYHNLRSRQFFMKSVVAEQKMSDVWVMDPPVGQRGNCPPKFGQNSGELWAKQEQKFRGSKISGKSITTFPSSPNQSVPHARMSNQEDTSRVMLGWLRGTVAQW